MKYLAAYLLLQKGGNDTPSAKEISAVLNTVGAEVDNARIEALLAAIGEKSINELIAEGLEKLASVPAGGAAAPAAGAAAGGAAAEEKKEEKKEEAKEESDDDMGFGLFD